MSRASAWVRFPDGEIRCGLYCGTSDVLWPALFATSEEAWEDYGRTHEPDGGPPGQMFHVEIANNYGDGTWWEGTATREFIIGPLDAFDVWLAGKAHDGYPGWLEEWVK